MKKKLTVTLALAALLLAGCNHDKEFATSGMADSLCLYYSDGPDDSWPIYEKNSYSVAWPAEGTLSAAAQRELMALCFDDSAAASVEDAAQRWLRRIWFTDDESLQGEVIGAIADTIEHSYVHLQSTCRTDSALATFTVNTESYGAGAAHGLYSSHTLTVDLVSGNVVRLTDLVSDTNLLCEAIARAIFDLEANRDVRECLFDEYQGVDRMPMPADFFVDSARNNITVSYDLYHIQPYACGIPSVVLPVFWLSKHSSSPPTPSASSAPTATCPPTTRFDSPSASFSATLFSV